MSSPALSLVGFMEEAPAIRYLSLICCPANPDPAVLKADWQAATATLGAPFSNCGNPQIDPVRPSHALHAHTVLQDDLFKQPMFVGSQVAMVEIDPILAYQFHVDTSRSNHHSTGFTNPPNLDELFNICLPLSPTPEQLFLAINPQSIIIKSKSLNVKSFNTGVINRSPDIVGMHFGVTSPFVHVVRFNGRCYLHNGFHRAYGARIAGATSMPCVLRDVATADQIGIVANETFDYNLLTNANAPTLAHFTQGRAHSVSLRNASRVLHVSWAEYVLFEE